MSQTAVRAALAVVLLGVLGVWLVKPIGDACSDLGKLPAGSTGTSAPSFAPPLTRTCTYTTADGTKARKRYVPVVDWLIVAVVAGVVGAGAGLVGPSTPRPERAPGPGRAPRRERPGRAARPQRPGRAARTERAPKPEPAPEVAQSAEERAAQRERERQERARRRERG